MPISRETDMQAQLLDAVGKQYGLAFVLTDKLEHANGLYVKGKQSNRIVLSLDAEGGILTAAAGHEVFHYLKENAADAANSLQKFTLQRLLATEGFDLNAELEKYGTRYALEIQGMTEKEQRRYLLEELTADSMFSVFSSKQAVALYAKQQPKNAKKVAKAIRNFYEKVKKALETLAFKGMGTVSALQQQAQTLEQISDSFFTALAEAQANRRQNKNTADVTGGAEIRYSRIGNTHDGRSIYKTNFKKGTPKAEKSQVIIDLVQKAWSYQPIKLVIFEDGTEKTITVKFNPELAERSDLAKIAFGNRKGTASEKRITLDLASDLYAIAKESTFVKSKKETGKHNPTHDGVTHWYYFVTNLVYQDEQDNKIDCYMNIDVKQNSDGAWFYSFALEKGTAPQTLLAVVADEASTTVPIDIISTNSENVNTEEQFSTKISTDTEDHNDRLRNSDATYAEAEQALGEAVQKMQTAQGGGLNGETIANLAQTAAEKLRSKYDAEQFKKAFTDIFSYLSQGGSIKTAVDMLSEFYLQALETSRSKNIDFSLQDAVKETVRDLRKNPVVLTENQIKAITAAYGNYANFHKASFGKILFKKHSIYNQSFCEAKPPIFVSGTDDALQNAAFFNEILLRNMK